MSKPARLTILCEDLQQACFVRRFLMNRGWTRYDLYEKIAPAGRGSGQQWVRAQFPRELRAYRSKRGHLRNGLVAVLDADRREVADILRDLNAACDEQKVPPKRPDERVLIIVPKRNIETWFAHLRGEVVDEESAYERYSFESQCHRDADRLDTVCRQESPCEIGLPPSLTRCCSDFRRFWRDLQP